MIVSLSDIIRGLVAKRAATIAGLANPVLVWELPPNPNPEATWAGTSTGPLTRPRDGEPLVLTVQKAASRKSAFVIGATIVTVGRVNTNDIQVDDASVSRFHAFLRQEVQQTQWSLSDAGSRNGTFLDGVRLNKHEKVELRDGALVRFGDAPMRFMLPGSLVKFIDGLSGK